MGLGWPAAAKDFKETTRYPGRIYVDETGAAYRAATLGRLGFLGLFRPRTWISAMRAKKAGHSQGKVKGDPWQLGGTFVVAAGGRVLYAHRNRSPEDDAPIDDVLNALRRA